MAQDKSNTPPSHTPGPLVVAGPYHFGSHESAYNVEQEGGPVTAICAFGRGDEEGKAAALADARLYRTAPEMFEALKTTLGNLKSLKHTAFRQFSVIDEWIAVVEAAIAKATGGDL